MQLLLKEKNVVTQNTHQDNFILWSFSNSTGSSVESFIEDWFADLGISFALMWPLRLLMSIHCQKLVVTNF